MADALSNLEKEYCPPLDPALLHALYFDYSEQPDGIETLRTLLDGFKQVAVAEQLTDFDPSGSSGAPVPAEADDHHTNTNSWASQTTETDDTGLSAEYRSLSLGHRTNSGSEDSWNGGYYKDTEHFDTPTKEILLAETFPSLRLQFVTHTLKKCGNDLSRATDELLNQVYLEDAQSSPGEDAAPRGIDAFAEEFNVTTRSKKGKKKNRNGRKVLQSYAASETDAYSAPPSNRWNNAEQDITFIASKTNLPTKLITSLYHKNGAALAPTIMALIQKDTATHENEEPHASHIQSAIDLTSGFPALSIPHALSLIRLTDPSTANAHQLAKSLLTPILSAQTTTTTPIIPQYTPLNLPSPSTQPPATTLPSLAPSLTPHTTASLATTRTQAFTSASSAYRKGRSDPLMRAAAGYYSQLGRDANTLLRASRAADTDRLIASQSSPTVLDLHGASVADAVRIATTETRRWWDQLGEKRIPGSGREGVGDGYRVVTGVGRHSEGGRGKLGPAVTRALIRDGWRVEVGSGEVRVLGVARR